MVNLMWKRSKDQLGMALPMAIMIMVIASLIVVPGLWAAGSMAKVNQELESSTVAYYAAKAGIENAAWKLKNTNFQEGSPFPVLENINGMRVETSLDTPFVPSYTGQTYVISSRAIKDGVTKSTIHAKMNVTYNPSPSEIEETQTGSGYWTYAVEPVEGTPPTEPVWVPGTDPVWVPPTPETPGTPGVNGYPFEYAVATTGGLLWIKNNSNVNSLPNPPNGVANVFSNGELRKDTATGFVNGKGYYTTGTSVCTNFTGGCQKVAEGIEFQTLDETWYWDQAKLGLAYPAPSGWPNTALPTTYGTATYVYDGERNRIKVDGTSTWTTIGTVKNPTYLGGEGNISYIDGNLKLEKNFVMRGVLWVNGSISIEGLTYIYTDRNKQSYLLAHGAADHGIRLVTNSKIMAENNNLNLMSDYGYITLESGIDGPTISAPVLLGILYAPNGAIIVNSNSDAVTSAILGKSVTLDANVTVNYDTALKDNPPEGFELNVTPVGGTPGTEGYWIPGTEGYWIPGEPGTAEIPGTGLVYHEPEVGVSPTGTTGGYYWVVSSVSIAEYSGP